MGIFDGILGGLGSLVGGFFDRDSRERQADENIRQQLNYAQNSLQWRANDASAAQRDTGINRLTMLGVPSSSFSNIVGDSNMAGSLGAAGQEIGRAIAAGTATKSRADELNEKLLEAKIANVNADTVRLQAGASRLMTTLGAPGLANVPMPPEDPRGPVIPLVQRARDPRTGEIVWIPSEKAASPLQTIAASPINAAIAAGTVYDAVRGESRPWNYDPGGFVAPGAASRATENYNWTYGVP